jgi:ribosomal protein S27AE
MELCVFGSGLVFLGQEYFPFKGGWSFAGERPGQCDRCGPSRFHAHGTFDRMLTTLRNGRPHEVVVWKPRWICTRCGCTLSSAAPDVAPRRSFCDLLIAALLRAYFSSEKGIHDCLPEHLEDAISDRHLARIIAAALERALETQQVIRDVVLEKTEPRPMESFFPDGLDPPENLVRRSRHSQGFRHLWQAMALVLAASRHLSVPVARLLAWARRRAQERQLRFLA